MRRISWQTSWDILKTGLPYILKPVPTLALTLLRLTNKAVFSTDAAIQQKVHGSLKTQIISNDVMEGIMKIVKSLEQSGLLMKGAFEAIVNKAKEQKGGLFSNFLVD